MFTYFQIFTGITAINNLLKIIIIFKLNFCLKIYSHSDIFLVSEMI
jgi:hypothetical protein